MMSRSRNRLCRKGQAAWGRRQPAPAGKKNGAGNETRTRDIYLGKVVLYQLSYARSSGEENR